MSSDNDAVASLRTNAKSVSLHAVSDSSIQLADATYPKDTNCTFTVGDKTLTYSLLSLVLLIQDPKNSYLQYKKICRKYSVKDSVTASEKDQVLEYFIGASAVEEEGSIQESSVKKEGKRVRLPEPVAKNEKAQKSKKRSSRVEEKKAPVKKDKTPMTQEQIMENLNIVVDKRGQKGEVEATQEEIAHAAEETEMVMETDVAQNDGIAGTDEPPKLLSQEEEERQAIQACLSAAGYDATKISPEVLENDRAKVTEKITSLEIPVGDSASILRCGATATNASNKRKAAPVSSDKNFARVLELYADSMKRPRTDNHDHKGSRSSTPVGSAKKATKPTGKPIIVVPNAMTSPLTLINAMSFFQKSHFIPREVAMKSLSGPKPTSVTVKRTVSARQGGGTVEYEIIDNPARKLKTPSDWDRVVAVVAQGAAWQFKGWNMARGRETNPVDVFSKAFGYYVGYEGAPDSKELQGWNVRKGYLSKDKRGLDSVVYASFWNGLDEWMSVHKRDYLPA